MSRELITGGGVSIDADYLLMDLKIGDGYANLERHLLRLAGAAEAGKRGVTASEDDLRAEHGAFYSRHDLMEPEQIAAWHENLQIDPPQLHRHLEIDVLNRKLTEALAPEETVQARFQASLHDYTKVMVEDIRLHSEGGAREILLSLREDEMSWKEATAHGSSSLEAYEIKRRDALKDIAALLFSAESGTFVGPGETDEGESIIYRVISRHDPELDETVFLGIQNEIIRENLMKAFSSDPVRYVL